MEDKKLAQKSVDRIRAFREELSHLRERGVVDLSEGDLASIESYHDGVLAELTGDYDVDVTTSEHQLSWGMRVASTLGAVALSFSVFSFFDSFWELLSTPLRVGLAVALPAVGLGLTEWLARRFQTPYYTSIGVIAAAACFVANLFIIAHEFNVTPSPNAFLAWGLFGLFLGYRHGLRFVVGASLLSLIVFVGGAATNLFGFAWPEAVLPEFYLVAGLGCIAMPAVARLLRAELSAPVYAFVGLFCAYAALAVLVIWPEGSLLPWPLPGLKAFYTVVSFFGFGLGIWWSIRKQQTADVYLSVSFMIGLLVYKFFDWFWAYLTAPLFFLVLGALAFGVISVLKNQRIVSRRGRG